MGGVVVPCIAVCGFAPSQTTSWSQRTCSSYLRDRSKMVRESLELLRPARPCALSPCARRRLTVHRALPAAGANDVKLSVLPPPSTSTRTARALRPATDQRSLTPSTESLATVDALTVRATPLSRAAPRDVPACPRASARSVRKPAHARLGHHRSQDATTKCWPKPTRSTISSTPRSAPYNMLKLAVKMLARSCSSFGVSASVIARCAPLLSACRPRPLPLAPCPALSASALCVRCSTVARLTGACARLSRRSQVRAGSGCAVRVRAPRAPARVLGLHRFWRVRNRRTVWNRRPAVNASSNERYTCSECRSGPASCRFRYMW